MGKEIKNKLKVGKTKEYMVWHYITNDRMGYDETKARMLSPKELMLYANNQILLRDNERIFRKAISYNSKIQHEDVLVPDENITSENNLGYRHIDELKK